MTTEHNLEIALRYLATVGKPGGQADAFFADDVVQVEFPNRLIPQGTTRDLAGLREAAARGQSVMSAQRFDVLNAFASGDQVAIEARWTGQLATALGSLPVGGEMTATFAIILQFRDGKIVRQHNYDCFDPW